MTRMMMRRRGNSDSVMYISPNSSSVSKVISRSCRRAKVLFLFVLQEALHIATGVDDREHVREELRELVGGVSIDCCRIAFR